MKRFLSDPDRGRPREQLFSHQEDHPAGFESFVDQGQSYIELERQADADSEESFSRTSRNHNEVPGRTVDVVLSDMSAPFDQTTGFWKRSLSDPYIRMMNTSGINFKDHAGSMVSNIGFGM